VPIPHETSGLAVKAHKLNLGFQTHKQKSERTNPVTGSGRSLFSVFFCWIKASFSGKNC
jgi:hypothetical protein